MPVQSRHPAGHPLDDQGAVVRVRRDQPRDAHRGPVPDERTVCGYFVPDPLGPYGEWSSKHLATAVLRPVVPTRSTERPLRRSTCTGANSGQIRCTDAIAVRSWAPWGPDKSSLPLSGWVPSPGTRRVLPVPGTGAVGRAGSR